MNQRIRESVQNWPAGHRAALCPIILLDTPSLESTHGDMVGGDYAPAGFDRLLSVFADLDLTASVGATSAAEWMLPTLIAKAAGMGLEIVHWSSRRGVADAPAPATDNAYPDGSAGHVAGLPHLPAPSNTFATGRWIVDGTGGDRPTLRSETCVIPTSPYWVDSAWLNPAHPLPPSSFLEAWSLSLAEVRTAGALMTVLLHAEVSGRLGISSQILRFLDEVIESGDVWIANAGQIADYWRQETFG